MATVRHCEQLVLRKWMLAMSLVASAFSSSALGQAQMSKTKIVDNIYKCYWLRQRTTAVNTSSIKRFVEQPELGNNWRRLSVHTGCETPPNETNPS